jgi:translation elongation factor EF-1alpha
VSDYIEIISPQTMMGKLLYQGEVIDEYKIEQCDKCSQLKKFDKFGYQKGYDRTDNIIWFCGDCR